MFLTPFKIASNLSGASLKDRLLILEADPIDYFDHDEFQASLDAPDPVTSPGVRDRLMLHLAHAAGLKVSELIGSCAVFSDS